MKTKTQKQEDVKKGEELLKKSEAVLLVDFSSTDTKSLSALRRQLKADKNPFFVIKKRLLSIVLKKHEMDLDTKASKAPTGAVFASNMESAASAVYKFFKELEKEGKVTGEKILGAFDVKKKEFMPAANVIAIGQLPPREVLLAQLAGMIAAPVRSFLYILAERANQMGVSHAPVAPMPNETKAESPVEKTAEASTPAPEHSGTAPTGEQSTEKI